MSRFKSIAQIRRDYGLLNLSVENTKSSPLEQFELWFEEVLDIEKADPTAMVLSTIDHLGRPDSRVVLLKNVIDETFVFFTNYNSIKSLQLEKNPYAALNFYWPEMARQVRIRGPVTKINSQHSDEYFASRPLGSQLSAIISPQSEEIESRQKLEDHLNELIEQYQQSPVMRPKHWGGFAVAPEEMEFWQGRENRLHDRIHYSLQNGQWIKKRLAP